MKKMNIAGVALALAALATPAHAAIDSFNTGYWNAQESTYYEEGDVAGENAGGGWQFVAHDYHGARIAFEGAIFWVDEFYVTDAYGNTIDVLHSQIYARNEQIAVLQSIIDNGANTQIAIDNAYLYDLVAQHLGVTLGDIANHKLTWEHQGMMIDAIDALTTEVSQLTTMLETSEAQRNHQAGVIGGLINQHHVQADTIAAQTATINGQSAQIVELEQSLAQANLAAEVLAGPIVAPEAASVVTSSAYAVTDSSAYGTGFKVNVVQAGKVVASVDANFSYTDALTLRNFADDFYNEGYVDGYQDGYNVGYTDGFAAGVLSVTN